MTFRLLIPLFILILASCGGDSTKDTSTSTSTSTSTFNRLVTNKGSISLELDMISIPTIEKSLIQVSSLSKLSLPNKVDLNNIKITGNTITNNTPYKISELVLKKNDVYTLVSISPILESYTKGFLSSDWISHEVVNYTTISNSTFEYQATEPPILENVKSVWANEEQRNTVERFQIYDRFMMNAPTTLGEITDFLRKTCHQFSECKSYGKPVEQYASDTYFAKSISGINTRFWIHSQVWGLASRPSMEFQSSKKIRDENLWMHPNLMANIHSSLSLTAIDAWQALAHEYYHNHGFTHFSGWSSSPGVDDLFGKKAFYDYRKKIGNNLILPDIFIKSITRKPGNRYDIKLYKKNKNQGKLYLRLLSTSKIDATIVQNSTDTLSIIFNSSEPEKITNDMYMSFYLDSSKQMSTIIRTPTIFIKTQLELNNFNSHAHLWLKNHEFIAVETANGRWLKKFILPTKNIGDGKIIQFKSQAGYQSTIEYNTGSTDILYQGKILTYRFNKDSWEKVL